MGFILPGDGEYIYCEDYRYGLDKGKYDWKGNMIGYGFRKETGKHMIYICTSPMGHLTCNVEELLQVEG